MFKLEDGIPLADPKVSKGQLEKYPWSKMQVGQSFLVPDEKKVKNISAAARHAKKRHGIDLRVRTVEGGVRVWRVG